MTTAVTQRRLATASETALSGLRTRAFTHIHRLSLATLTNEKRGVLVARVTSDVDTLSRFFEWGGVAWLVNGALMVVTFITMLVYDWRLAIVTLVVVSPLPVVLRLLQGRLATAYDLVRSRVGELLGGLSESVQGALVVRAYGVEERTTGRVTDAIDRYRDSTIKAGLLAAFLFPTGELVATMAVAACLLVGVALGPASGLSTGELVAYVFLVRLFLQPISVLIEIFDQTQTAVAGWRKVLDVLDTPVDVVDPVPGVELGSGRADAGGRPGELRLRRRGPGARGREPAHRVGAAGGAGRGHRVGQDHAGQAADPTRRSRPRGGSWPAASTCARRRPHRSGVGS